MAYLIGTDEAGYGPNLGPLVVSATMWRVPDPLLDTDFYDLLSEAVSDGARPSTDDHRLAIADSKALYQSRGSLAPLEQGVLALLATLEKQPTTWQAVLDTLDPDSRTARAALPWYRDFELAVPACADSQRIAAAAEQLRHTLGQVNVSLHRVRSRILHVPQFNELVSQYDSKGFLLSHTTLSLVADLIDEVGGGPIRVLCDKHGGRNRYAALLQGLADTGLVQVVVESRAESRYRFETRSRAVDIRFSAKGERFLPVAVASMMSKYVRELAMLALNRYWCDRVGGLKPTAGYPTDARRWFAAVETTKENLQIDNHLLWRSR